MNWKKVKLGDVCTKIGSGATPKGGSMVYIEKGTTFIRSQNVYNLNFEYNGLVFINEEAARKLNGVTIKENDILLNITGDSVARTCLVPPEFLPARVNQHVSIVRPNSDILNPIYLNYYLASPFMQSFMLGLAVGKGASRNAMTKDMIANFEIPCPPLEIQKRIINILKPYDELVENNKKQIKLLEEATQRLYKEWFVDLRFPGYEDVDIIDGKPSGWKLTQIKDICDKMNAGGTPSRKKFAFWNNATIKWYKTGELQDCWLIDSDEYISKDGLNGSSAKLFPKNTIIMAIYASPTIGRLGVLSSEAACNQAALCFVADENKISWQWLYHKLYELRDEFNAIAHGAGQQNISAETVKNKEIILPQKDLIDRFTVFANDYFEKRLTLQLQNNLLEQARNRLLSKLMNGEIEM